jgi:hypothetical protein
MIDLTVQELLHRFNNPQATHEGTVNVILQGIGQPEFARGGISVATFQRFSFQTLIVFGDANEKIHFFRIEEPLAPEKTIAVELIELILG